MKTKDFEISSGNIFADLEVSNPEERLAKVKLAIQINHLIEVKELNQKDAAKLLGIDQPKISALSKGKLAGFSLERLFRFLNILGQDITIEVTPRTRTKKKPNINVSFSKIKQKPVAKINETTSTRAAMSARKKGK
jgi:predicted XRE-type DNA-binding protein